MAHPETPNAIALARKGDWTLLHRIFGWEYITNLRRAMASDDEVIRYIEAAH